MGVNSFAVVWTITRVICTHRLNFGFSSGEEQRGEKGGEMEHGKRVDERGAGVHPSPSHTELGGEKEKKAIVADKRAIQLSTPRT